WSRGHASVGAFVTVIVVAPIAAPIHKPKRGPTRGDAIDAANGRTPVLEVRHVDVAFGSKVIFEDLNLTVYEGEVLVILGFSGSGKSVLLKLLSGLIEPAAGEILYRGSNIA